MVQRVALLTFAAPWPENPLHGTFNIEQAAALQRLGVQCEIFAPMMWVPRTLGRFSGAVRRMAARPRDYTYDGVAIHVERAPLPHPVFLRWKVVPYAPSLVGAYICRAFLRKLKRRLEAYRPDLLLVHDGLAFGKLGAELAKRLNVRWAVIEHDVIDLPPDSRAGQWYSRTLAGAAAVFTVNRQSQSHLRDVLKLPQARLLANGARPPTAAQLQTPRPHRWAGKKLIVSVGSFIPRKGHIELVRGFLETNVPNSVLLIIGGGTRPPEFDRLLAKANRDGVQRVEVMEPVLPQEIPQYMVWADLFALPSWWEAFGLVYVEAMAAGTAVLMTSDSGVATEIEAGVHGWIVPPRDHAALVAALREALSSADLETMGRAGQKLVQEKFSWDKNARQLLEGI